MTLSEQIIADLTEAMKAKDADRVGTLRLVKAALTNRKIDKGADLDEGEIIKTLQTLVKQRRDSIDQYRNAGRDELAAKEQNEIDIISVYLPQAATDEEIAAAVDAAIRETGASTMKDMGLVMKAVLARLADKSPDGKAVSEAVKGKLS
ncbi:MAG: GatB/YqeY domain-containing protein [Chloracidobacterium sp.]|nr:GatB/YqeY domain-containing protein [Chloracidobacterium sp.]MCO5333469.1 GatB/YqeY domain-containing protein [Pyrinomonadaceae bacterium]